MCDSHHNPRKIDKCMEIFIMGLNEQFNSKNIKILACCCGHKRYPMSIIVKANIDKKYDIIEDLVSGQIIPRKKRFYIKDINGYYFIPETLRKR